MIKAPLTTSSIGRKVLMAVTGLLLLLFLFAHMLGNLQAFFGPELINAYGHHLRELPILLWVARVGLLVLFLMHVLLALSLTTDNYAARPIDYVFPRTFQKASFASRFMLESGFVILAFVIYHLLHYTFFAFNPEFHSGAFEYRLRDGAVCHDVYRMVVTEFKNPVITAIYVAAQGLLFLHLGHGIASMLKTLGINSYRLMEKELFIGYGVAALLCLGYLAVPIGIISGFIPDVAPSLVGH